MTRYLDEAFQVYDAVKRTGKIFQLGTQGCSAGAWHKAAELVRGGKIGVQAGQAPISLNSSTRGISVSPIFPPLNLPFATRGKPNMI